MSDETRNCITGTDENPQVDVFLGNGHPATMLLSDAAETDKPEGMVMLHISATLFQKMYQAMLKEKKNE